MKNNNFSPFTDDFIFSLVMRDPGICRDFLNLILDDEDIGEVKIVSPDNILFNEDEDITSSTQTSMKFVKNMHGIRFDAYIKSKDIWAIIEMQTVSNKSLGKRARYYRCSIDYDCLEQGEDYEKLKTTYVIFICTFDYLKKDLPIYFFRSWDAENSLPLNDFAYTILLNTKCSKEKVPETLRELYEYINNPEKVGNTPLVQNINKRVKKFNSSEWRTKQMTYEYYLKQAEEKGRNEGLEQGRTEGLEQGRTAEKLEMAKTMKSDGMPINKIIMYTGLSAEEINNL